jgi:glycosyltransferase involved in cell wall biosynthesis
MRILIITFDYDPVIGGQAIYVREIVKALSGHHEIIIEHSDGKLMNGIGPLFYSLKINFRINKIIRLHKPDIVHIQTGPGGIQMIRTIKVPILLTIHHTYIFNLNYKKGILTSYFWIMTKIEKICFRNSTHMIVISDMLSENIRRLYEINGSKISLIYNGYNDSIFKFNGKKRDGSIVYAGRLEARKGLMQTIHVMKDIPEHMLYIIGDGYYKKNLKEAAKGMPNVEFINKIPHLELARYYSRASVSLMPSDFEAFGLSAVEATACGTPTIVTKSCGAAELIEKVDRRLVISDNTSASIKEAIKYAIRRGPLKKSDIKILPNWNEISLQTEKSLNKCIS